MDEKYKRSYRWRLTAMIMLFLLVLAVIFIAIFALPNDEGQPTTETNKTISGSVNFTGATDNTFYIKEVRLQEGEDEAEVLSITPGYINNGFAFTEIGEVSSDDIKLYFDIINSTMNTAVISSSWTDTEVDGVTFSVIEESRYLSAGTGEEITEETQINGTLILELNLYNTDSFNLSNITMSFDEPEVYTWWYFETNEEDKTATLTSANATNGILEVPAYVSYDEETRTWVSGPDYKVVALDGVDIYHGTIARDVTELILPETVVEIGDYTFCNGGFIGTTLDLSNTNIERIGSSAFIDCTLITSIILPESLTTIESLAFGGCENLEYISFPTNTNINYINNNAFNHENLQPTIVDEYGVEYMGNEDNPYVVLWDASELTAGSYEINEKCEVIYYNAFEGLTTLTNVTFPSSITKIFSSSFNGCTSLTGINLSDCIGLTSIADAVFFDCSGLTNIALPESLKNIGDYAFVGCTELTSIKLPNSIESVGRNAFSNCIVLQVQIDDYGVKYIGNDDNPYLVLLDASGLTTDYYVVNSNCKVIGAYAFNEITTLTNITLSSSLAFINNDAFYNCTNLIEIDLSGCTNLTSIGENTFYGCESLTTIDLSGCTNLTDIGEFIFYNCTSLTTLDLSGCTNLTSIGGWAFNQCSSLTTLDLSGCTNLTSIGIYAFSGCSGLTNIALPESLKNIGDYAFSGCTGLTSIILPENLTTIKERAFYNCSSLIALDLSGCTNLISIEDWAFLDCVELTTLDLSECINLTSIGEQAFRECSSLTTLDLSGCTNLTSIGSSAFIDCVELTTIDLSGCTNLTSIGNYAFYNCSNITSTILNQYIFENATSDTACGNLLQNITSGETVYVPANLIDELHLTNSYLDGDTFTRSESAENGYYVYTKI